MFETSWRRTAETLLLRSFEMSSRRSIKILWRRSTETSWHRFTKTSFKIYLRYHWDVHRDVVTMSLCHLVVEWVLHLNEKPMANSNPPGSPNNLSTIQTAPQQNTINIDRTSEIPLVVYKIKIMSSNVFL